MYDGGPRTSGVRVSCWSLSMSLARPKSPMRGTHWPMGGSSSPKRRTVDGLGSRGTAGRWGGGAVGRGGVGEGERLIDLELELQVGFEAGEAGQVISEGRHFAGLLAEDDLVIDQVEGGVVVAGEVGVACEEVLDADAFAALP